MVVGLKLAVFANHLLTNYAVVSIKAGLSTGRFNYISPSCYMTGVSIRVLISVTIGVNSGSLTAVSKVVGVLVLIP